MSILMERVNEKIEVKSSQEKYDINLGIHEWKRYPEYKDSGLEWIGEIPAGWEIKKLKYLASSDCNSFVDGPFGSDLKNEEYQDSGVPLIQLNNINEGEHIIQNIKFVSEEKAQLLSRHIIYPNEIVIAKMADPVARAACVKNEFEKYVIVADCVKFSPGLECSNTKFLVYAINSKYIKYQAELLSGGTTRLRINLGSIKQLYALLPPLKEQDAISSFLDLETAKIDILIEKKQYFIELLEEKRSVLISHAVTKGLDPDVKMKDSGVGWIGVIPESWNIKPFRRICTVSQGLQIAQSERFYESADNRLEYITIKSIHDKNVAREYIEKPPRSVICHQSDILLARTGATGEVVTNQEGVFHNNFFLIKYDSKEVYRDFLVYYLKNKLVKDFILLLAGTTTIPDLNHGDFLDVPFVSPSFSEQQHIVNFLNLKTEKIDTLINKISAQIEKLKEYRTALISAAVTGKIDVREEVA